MGLSQTKHLTPAEIFAIPASNYIKNLTLNQTEALRALTLSTSKLACIMTVDTVSAMPAGFKITWHKLTDERILFGNDVVAFGVTIKKHMRTAEGRTRPGVSVASLWEGMDHPAIVMPLLQKLEILKQKHRDFHDEIKLDPNYNGTTAKIIKGAKIIAGVVLAIAALTAIAYLTVHCLPAIPMLLTKSQLIVTGIGAFLGLTGVYTCLSKTEIERAEAYLKNVGTHLGNLNCRMDRVGASDGHITEYEVEGTKKLLAQIRLDAGRLIKVASQVIDKNNDSVQQE